MKIATTTGDFGRFFKNDIDRIKALHSAGFRYVDLDMYSLSHESDYMKDNWKETINVLKSEAERLGMKFVQAHSQGGNAFKDDPAHVEFLVASTLRSIEICAELGIENTVVHSGYAKGMSKDEWFEKNREFYKKLFPAMENFGVNVLIENSTTANMKDKYFVNSGKDMVEFLRFVGHPQLHVCWDTGHANCEGSQYDEIMTLGKELYAIHYNDNRGQKDEHLIPFMGTLNHDEVMNALIDVDFKGYFTLEATSSLRSSRYWLGNRMPFEKDTRLAEPQLFMQRRLEPLLYETAKYILQSYGAFEE